MIISILILRRIISIKFILGMLVLCKSKKLELYRFQVNGCQRHRRAQFEILLFPRVPLALRSAARKKNEQDLARRD
jgi:hypothetical protein